MYFKDIRLITLAPSSFSSEYDGLTGDKCAIKLQNMYVQQVLMCVQNLFMNRFAMIDYDFLIDSLNIDSISLFTIRPGVSECLQFGDKF